MVLMMPEGGLANRLRGISAALLLAEALGQRLHIAWLLDSGCNCRFEQLFQPDSRFAVTDIQGPPTKAVKGLVRAVEILSEIVGHARLPVSVMSNRALARRDYRIALDGRARRRRYLVHSFNDFFSGDVAPDDYSRTAGATIRSLRPAEAIARRVATQPAASVGVQVRRTDLSNKTQPLSQFTVAMQREIDANGAETFFLATDEPEVERELRQQFGTRIMTIGAKAFERDSPQGIQDALVDLLSLARTRKLLGSYHSSFGEIASVLGNIELEVVGYGKWAGLGANIAARPKTNSMAFR